MLGLLTVSLMAAACSSPAADVAPPSSAVAPLASATLQATLLPLPEASLGAQSSSRVQVELYLKSTADVAEQVDVTVAFRADGKEFTRATISQALQPGEAVTVVVTPPFKGNVPMGYTSAIVSMKASDHVIIDSGPSQAATQAPVSDEPIEPSTEAVPPSDDASVSADVSSEPTGEQIESSGDFVCHAGIDSLPDLTRGSSRQADVLALQVVLSQVGYSSGPLDGLFGKRTEAAVKSFQGDYGLTVDGQVGPRTWETIVNAYC